jgi:biopolymer transport protein ExbB/biopolymer transport protein TolQ
MQTGAPLAQTTRAPREKENGMFQNLTILDILMKGGPVFILLLCVSLLTVFVIIERALAIAAVRKNSRKFVQQILTRSHAGKFEEATVLCREQDSHVSDIFLAALVRRNNDKAVIAEAVEREGGRLAAFMEKRLHILATIGSTTPFIGLFGTVLGIINAFNSISASASYAPALVSNGIAEALVNTAAGLAVAIPAVLTFNWFTQRIQAFTADLQLACSELIEVLVEGQIK